MAKKVTKKMESEVSDALSKVVSLTDIKVGGFKSLVKAIEKHGYVLLLSNRNPPIKMTIAELR